MWGNVETIGWEWIGAAVAGAILTWLMGRQLSVPGRVASLEQRFKAHEKHIAETYVRMVGTVDNPGHQAALSRIQKLESLSEFQATAASAEHTQLLGTMRLALEEIQAVSRTLARLASDGGR